MKTKITELLQIEYPVFQGGMAWVAEHKLAAAVSNAGGLGIIGAASAPPEVVREEIRKCKELTDKPFGVNIMLLNPNAEDVAKIVVEEGVKAVTTGAGNPGKFMELWKNAGVKVIPVVASVAMAKMMERAGADAVVAEGMESGGHIGSTTTMALVPQVVDAVSIPVIAAGGIADGRGMAAAFMLGAEGIQMGTRFVASKESIVHENYKNQIIKAKDIDSVVTGMSTGHPVRSLRNQMTREYLKLEKENADFMELEKLTLGSLRKAVQDGGHVDVGAVSLVSDGSTGVMFNVAGMQPLMPYLLGQKHPLGTRLCNVQGCVRTNDIDSVGDKSHVTFFEMMGSWSLGDYFKKERCQWSFELLTQVFGFDADHLAATVFAGDENAPRDEEGAHYRIASGFKKEMYRIKG